MFEPADPVVNSWGGTDTFLNAPFNHLRWKYQRCHSSGALWERLFQAQEASWLAGGQTQQVRILADLIYMLLIGGRVTRTAYEPVHLAVVAMDTGPLV